MTELQDYRTEQENDTTEQLIPVSVTEIDVIAELTVSAMDVYRLVNQRIQIFILDKSTL